MRAQWVCLKIALYISDQQQQRVKKETKKGWLITLLILLLHKPALFLTSLTLTTVHRMVAYTVAFSRLSIFFRFLKKQEEKRENSAVCILFLPFLSIGSVRFFSVRFFALIHPLKRSFRLLAMCANLVFIPDFFFVCVCVCVFCLFVSFCFCPRMLFWYWSSFGN